MYLAVCTIQRNNGKYIREWIIYHSLVGVSKFYFLCHKPEEDNTSEIIAQLISEGYDIDYNIINDGIDWYPIQIGWYNETYKKHNHKHKWMAFIDGDEFLIPVKENNLPDVLKKYEDQPLQALGVYWACYGSSGRVFEDDKLITESNKYRMEFNHRLQSNNHSRPNMHIKSIVKCGLDNVECYPGNMHIFNVDTKDELMRPFDLDPPYWFYDYDRDPSHSEIRINHYVLKSLQHYIENRVRFEKQTFGISNNELTRYWLDWDMNDVYDDIMDKYIPQILEKI